eukprot:3530912-Prymnesium_polylepis.1
MPRCACAAATTSPPGHSSIVTPLHAAAVTATRCAACRCPPESCPLARFPLGRRCSAAPGCPAARSGGRRRCALTARRRAVVAHCATFTTGAAARRNVWVVNIRCVWKSEGPPTAPRFNHSSNDCGLSLAALPCEEEAEEEEEEEEEEH